MHTSYCTLGIDLFRYCFNSCDLFNRHLNDYTFPHKFGAHKGAENKLSLAVLLQIFSVHMSLCTHFDRLRKRCEKLAKGLYEQSFTLGSVVFICI